MGNEFAILAIGDVYEQPGRELLSRRLADLKSRLGVDLCIVNGENSADGNGLSPSAAAELFTAGADVITTGNHAFQKGGAVYEDERILRPANYHENLPGRGFCIVDCGAVRVQVINAAGTVFLGPADNPFDSVLRCYEQRGDAVISVVDFHAEATSEKRAMGFFMDGKASFVYGTHTHVQTADEQLLPQGTAYITDLGMVGIKDSVIGLEPCAGVNRLREGTFHRIVAATEGAGIICGALARFDRRGNALSIERIYEEFPAVRR